MELFYLISTFDSRHMIKNVQAPPLPSVVVNETSSQYGHRTYDNQFEAQSNYGVLNPT